MNDPVSSAVQEVLDLFANELAELRFGDLEGGVLARAAEEVRAIASDVAHAEAELDRVRATLTEKQEALLQKVQRALAYARVYAEEQPELASRIEQIAVPRGGRRSAKPEAAKLESEEGHPATVGASRRRGRPRKMDPGATLLELPKGGALDTASVG